MKGKLTKVQIKSAQSQIVRSRDESRNGLHSFRFTDSPEGVHLSGRAAARLAAALLLLKWNQEGDAQAPQREIGSW